jgi:hypothetical protein
MAVQPKRRLKRPLVEINKKILYLKKTKNIYKYVIKLTFTMNEHKFQAEFLNNHINSRVLCFDNLFGGSSNIRKLRTLTALQINKVLHSFK